jgi:hypothetical protein
MSKGPQANDQAHPALAVLLSGTMALGLAAGLDFLKLIARFDAMLTAAFSPEGLEAPTLPLEKTWLWMGTAFLAFALPAVLLNVPGTWRRAIIWGGTFALTVTWGPVLVLAARVPEIGVALIAVIWSGFCAMYYASNHGLPVDAGPATPAEAQDGAR